jgi:hypothetical protein
MHHHAQLYVLALYSYSEGTKWFCLDGEVVKDQFMLDIEEQERLLHHHDSLTIRRQGKVSSRE